MSETYAIEGAATPQTDEPTRPMPRAGVLEITPYIPGKSKGTTTTRFKLSSNETPLGASSAAISAYQEAAQTLELYPDGASTQLREAIAEMHGLDPNRIMCGNGSDEILGLIAQAYCSTGDEVIHTKHGFLVYRIAALAADALPIAVEETNLTADVDAILAQVTERTKLIFLANPNNPTGSYLARDEINRLHKALPPHVLLVLDAAYAEYVNRNDYESGLDLAKTEANVITTRTFSKIHGLAALRIGWCYGPDHIIDALNRVRGPFNVSAASIAAGTAAIRDMDHVQRALEHNNEWLPLVTERLSKLGLKVNPSVGNFVLIQFPDQDGKRAPDADRYLLDRGLVLRRMEGYGLPNALRMTIGSADANEAVLEALTAFMA